MKQKRFRHELARLGCESFYEDLLPIADIENGDLTKIVFLLQGGLTPENIIKSKEILKFSLEDIKSMIKVLNYYENR